MAELSFGQELIKAGVSALSVALAGGLSVLLGWLLLRRQERIKRQEELAAGLRKLRSDSLIKALEVLGRYHNLKDRRLQFEGTPIRDADEYEELKTREARESQAAHDAVDMLADQQFLLGPLANPLGKTWRAMASAKSTQELSTAVARLHAELENWIPPLEPIRRPSGETQELAVD